MLYFVFHNYISLIIIIVIVRRKQTKKEQLSGPSLYIIRMCCHDMDYMSLISYYTERVFFNDYFKV